MSDQERVVATDVRAEIVALALKFGQRIAPNLISFNGQLYHIVADVFGFLNVTIVKLTVAEPEAVCFGWD